MLAQLRLEHRERRRVAEVLAGGVDALRAVERRGLAHARCGRRLSGIQRRDGITHDLLHGNLWVHELMYEGAVGTVLEQAPHEIRQQVLVRADRRIHPHRRHVRELGARRLVQRLAHTVQALEFAGRAGRRERQHRGDRVGVVGGELRVERIARREQDLRPFEVARIGRRLRGVNREARQPALLGALDLAVPVGALHEPHRHAPPAVAGELRRPPEHQRRAAAVGLHREAEPLPAARRGIARQQLHDVERQVEPVRLLGVDGHADAGARRAPCQLEHAGT